MSRFEVQELKYRHYPESDYFNVDTYHPLPVDGDSVYCKDIHSSNSDIGNFSGGITDLFDSNTSVISNTTSDNPKEITIVFNRTILTTVVSIGTYSGDFSNTKIDIILPDDSVLNVIDESASATKYTYRTFNMPIIAGFQRMKVSFSTTDTVSLSYMIIPKLTYNISRLQAVKPDDTIVDINATTGGNLKVSVEELESGISSNSNSQLNVTPFHSDGTEGTLITGVDYVSGKSGIDSSTESLQTIDYSHHEVHSGNHYTIGGYTTGAGVSDTKEIVLTTPNTTNWMHLTGFVVSSTGSTVQFYEGASGVSGGTTVTPVNNNRNSANTSLLSGVVDPISIAYDGVLLDGEVVGDLGSAGKASRESEYILKQNETYLLRVTSLAASNNISYRLYFYEHVNKN